MSAAESCGSGRLVAAVSVAGMGLARRLTRLRVLTRFRSNALRVLGPWSAMDLALPARAVAYPSESTFDLARRLDLGSTPWDHELARKAVLTAA